MDKCGCYSNRNYLRGFYFFGSDSSILFTCVYSCSTSLSPFLCVHQGAEIFSRRDDIVLGPKYFIFSCYMVYLFLPSRVRENSLVDPVFDCDDLQFEKGSNQNIAAYQH